MAVQEPERKVESLIDRALNVKQEIVDLRKRYPDAGETELPFACLGMPGDSKSVSELDTAILRWRKNLYECLEDCDAFCNLNGGMDKLMNLGIVRTWNNRGLQQIYFIPDCLRDMDRLVEFLHHLGDHPQPRSPRRRNGVPIPTDLPTNLEKAMQAYKQTQDEAAEAMGLDTKTIRRLLGGHARVRHETVKTAQTYIEAAPRTTPRS